MEAVALKLQTLTLIAVAGLVLASCSSAAPSSPAPTDTIATGDRGASVETVDKGAELYAAHCQVCHGDRDGIGTTQGAPPHNQAGHTWHHADAQLKDWILNGKLGFAQMPAFEGKLTEPEVDAILTYIKTWWTPEQRDTQADVSRRYQEALDKQQGG